MKLATVFQEKYREEKKMIYDIKKYINITLQINAICIYLCVFLLKAYILI